MGAPLSPVPPLSSLLLEFLVLSVLRKKMARTQFCVDWNIALEAVATLGYLSGH